MDGAVSKPCLPPPLPPKTKRNIIAEPVTSSTTTVLEGSTANHEMLSFKFPEVSTLKFNTRRSESSSQSVNSISSESQQRHVVKIRINTDEGSYGENVRTQHDQPTLKLPVTYDKQSTFKVVTRTVTPPQLHNHVETLTRDGCIRINVSSNEVEQHHPHTEEMVRRVDFSTQENFVKSSNDRNNPYFYYGGFPCATNGMVISSGQSSPSDTLDSGTCSDLDGSTPPPLPKKKSSISSSSSTTVTVIVNGGHHERTGSLTSSGADVDSDDEGSNISCDSLNSGDLIGGNAQFENDHEYVPEHYDKSKLENNNVRRFKTEITQAINTHVKSSPRLKTPQNNQSINGSGHSLPRSLLQDIRERTAKLTLVPTANSPVKKPKVWSDEVKSDNQRKFSRPPTPQSEAPESSACGKSPVFVKKHQELSTRLSSSSEDSFSSRKSAIVEERTYEDRKKQSEEKPKMKTLSRNGALQFDMDMFYKFHLNESFDEKSESRVDEDDKEDSFAGYKDLLEGKQSSSTIRSAKGTVRGVKNRVRAGITTFLQLQAVKGYKEKEVGKVVLYSTTMGVVRKTYQDCVKVKKILRNMMVKYEERDVFMSREVQSEIRDRMSSDVILVPQMFVEGQHIGDVETIEKLNESGELRRILKPFRSADACSECRVCGGYRLLPCAVCNGSKKSVHRNDFTAEFVALKCMNCDEVGLVKCYSC